MPSKNPLLYSPLLSTFWLLLPKLAVEEPQTLLTSFCFYVTKRLLGSQENDKKFLHAFKENVNREMGS